MNVDQEVGGGVAATAPVPGGTLSCFWATMFFSWAVGVILFALFLRDLQHYDAATGAGSHVARTVAIGGGVVIALGCAVWVCMAWPSVSRCMHGRRDGVLDVE